MKGRGEPVGTVRHIKTEVSERYEGVILTSAILAGTVEHGTRLYTHADPGEVEQLRAQLGALESLLRAHWNETSTSGNPIRNQWRPDLRSRTAAVLSPAQSRARHDPPG